MKISKYTEIKHLLHFKTYRNVLNTFHAICLRVFTQFCVNYCFFLELSFNKCVVFNNRSIFSQVSLLFSRRFFSGYSRLAKKYYFYVRISSIKVFSLLVTSIGEATGIAREYLVDILLILIWCILKLETFILRLVSSVFYWYALKKKVLS